MQHAVKSSPMDVVEEYFWEKIALRVRGLHAMGIILSSSQRCQWKANIPRACQPVMTFQEVGTPVEYWLSIDTVGMNSK